MKKTYRVVKRPENTGLKGQPWWPRDAVQATAKTGKAIEFRLNGHHLNSTTATIHESMKLRKLKAHVFRNGKMLTVWVTKP